MKLHAPATTVAAIIAVTAIGAGALGLWKQLPNAVARNHPSSYAELLALPEGRLTNVDVALMNLLCAESLTGAENLDVKHSITVLDNWASVVRQAERRYLSRFYDDPGRYDNSLAKFRAVNLVLTLKQDLGCDYNTNLITSGIMFDVRSTRFFRDSSDLFLHGFTTKRRGSCSSLPVLVVAIGRRCGYPLSLVACKGHLFCRWDDGRERFNLEAAIEGVDSRPDSYYQDWPYPCSDEELRTERYLKSLTAAEELGIFVQIRAACLQENMRMIEAALAYEAALKSFPESRVLRAHLEAIKGDRLP